MKEWRFLGFHYNSRGSVEQLDFCGIKLYMRSGVCRYLLGYSWVADYD